LTEGLSVPQSPHVCSSSIPPHQSAPSSPGGPEGLSPPPRQRPSPLLRVVRRVSALRRVTSPLPLPREVWRASALRRVTSPFPRPRVVRRASALRRVTSPFPLPPGGPEGLSPPPRYQSASSSPGGPEGLSPPPRQRPSPLPRVVWRGRSPSISNRARRHVRRARGNSREGELARRTGNFFLSGFASGGCEADSSKTRQGVAVAGESFSPVHMLRHQRSIVSSLFFAISIPVMGFRPVTGVMPSPPPAPTACGILPPF